jgi:hypothetical protein
VRKINAAFAVLLAGIIIVLSLPLFTASLHASPSGTHVTFLQIGRGSYGGVSERRFVVVRSPEEWLELWAEINGNVLPIPPAPQVDFTRNAVAAVFQGLKRSGGYSIAVQGIFESGDRITVTVREDEPGPRNLVTMALSSPWHAVVFPHPGKPVRFTCVP